LNIQGAANAAFFNDQLLEDDVKIKGRRIE
jgi:hypothetical protein